MNELSTLEHSVYRTLCWFSLFTYPLTAWEVYKWLWCPDREYRLQEVMDVLENSSRLKGRVLEQDGFYALSCDQGAIGDLIAQRREHFLDAVRKYEKLSHATKWFSLLGSVRAVAAVNTLSWWQTKPQSDIDMYIVVEPGTIWMTRLLLVLPFALLGRRPGCSQTDPFCFSFFVTPDALQTEPLRIEPEDPYLAYWTRSLVPVFDRDDVFDVFAKKNVWARRFLPNAEHRTAHREHDIGKGRTLIPAGLLRLLEKPARLLQEKRFPAERKEMMNKDTRVVVNDRMLKFHDHDDRALYRDRFFKRINELV